MIVLKGYNKDGDYLEHYFAVGEHATALHVARCWLKKGLKPFLYKKTWDGKFRVLYNYRRRAKAA